MASRPGPSRPSRLSRLPLPPSARRALAARRSEQADLRRVAPRIGRAPEPQDLLDHARGVIVEAMRDEFFREGLVLVDLPEDWTRRTLLEATIPEDAEYQAFIYRSLYALDLDADPQPLAHIEQLLGSPASADRVGLTLEAAGALARLLVHEAAERSAGTIQEERELQTLRSCAEGQLRRMVTVPQELRVAQQRLVAVESKAEQTRAGIAGAHRSPAAEGTSRAPLDSDTAAGGAGAPRDEDGSPGAADASDDADPADAAARPTLGERAGAVREFLESDTGRWTVDMVAKGAVAAASVPAVRQAGQRFMTAAAKQARQNRSGR